MTTKIGLAAVKTLLAAIFLYNIGLFSLFSRIDNGPQPPIKPDNGKADRQYLHEKLQRAQSLGEKNYTPEMYFADLSDIRLKERRNELDRFAVLEANQTISQLLSIFDGGIKFHRAHDSEKDYEALMARLSLARDKHERLVDPEAYSRRIASEKEMSAPGYWTGVLASLFAWLGRFYLKNILLALVLISIWWYQERGTWKINNPLSLLVCVIFYPAVIGRVWVRELRDGARRFALELEFRRRQRNLFALIAEDEMSYIRRFAHSNLRLRDYRLRLDANGLIIRQALLPAIMVTLVFMCVPQSSIAGAHSQHELKISCSIGQSTNVHASGFDWPPPDIGEFTFEEKFFPALLKISLPDKVADKLTAGFRNIPDPIPLGL